MKADEVKLKPIKGMIYYREAQETIGHELVYVVMIKLSKKDYSKFYTSMPVEIYINRRPSAREEGGE